MNHDVSRSELRGPVQAAGGMFLVGTLAGISGVIGDYPVYGGQALRYLAAAVILLAVARLAGLRFLRLTPREVALLVALALTGLVLFNVCVIEGTRHGGPALVGTVLGAVPLALALFGGRPSRRVLGAATVVVAGTTVATGLGSGDPAGLLWALGALGCEVCFSVLALPLLPRLGAVRVSAYSTVLAVPLLTAAGLLADGTALVRVPTVPEAAGLAYQAVFVTSVAFLLWYDALPRLGRGTAGLFAGLIPVGAIVTGVVLGLSVPTWPDLLGAALVVAGIAIGLSPRGSPADGARSPAAPARRPAAAGSPGAHGPRSSGTSSPAAGSHRPARDG
ncbi:DMT family transporter [Streptosporangium longisporum]